jgi:hypothetical protein
MPYTDDFNRASKGANWTDYAGVMEIYSSTKLGVDAAGSGADCICGYSAGTFANDQYAFALYASPNGLAEVGPATRCSTNNGIGINAPATYITLALMLSGFWSSLGSGGTTISAGTKVEVRSSGTSHSVYKDDVLFIGPFTNASLASGVAGAFGYSGAPGSANTALDSWEGGDLGGGAAGAFPSVLRARRRMVIDKWR